MSFFPVGSWIIVRFNYFIDIFKISFGQIAWQFSNSYKGLLIRTMEQIHSIMVAKLIYWTYKYYCFCSPEIEFFS